VELPVRPDGDRFVPPGGHRLLQARLRARVGDLAEMPALVFSAFDRRTRMLPFVFADARMFPCGPRSIGASLHEAGFTRTRIAYQLWNPRLQPSRAALHGRPIGLLLVSAMQIHAHAAYRAIRDAWATPGERPLIVAGGPKAQYEPRDFWLASDLRGEAAPDIVVTGESYVLLDLLDGILACRGRGETLRTAFERARREGALECVPGLVYLADGATLHAPRFVDTGVQRLVQHFDEPPDETIALGLLEPPHRGRELAASPLSASAVREHCRVLSLQVTQGCKFSCAYCPIPAANQRSWRSRSPVGVARQIRNVHERFGIREFFGTDDNFFNRRETAEDILAAMAAARTSRGSLGESIAFFTEATAFDTFKQRDLLPLARSAGMRGLWFGIEDLTATLVKKGQSADRTAELFRLLLEHEIRPHAMMMLHEGQPFYTRGSRYGLANQIAFLRRAGAVSIQCTVHMPAVGTREYERTINTGRVIAELGGEELPESCFDGNHVVVDGKTASWLRQLQVLAAYLLFYNPLNLIRAGLRSESRSLRRRRLEYLLLGMAGLVWTTAMQLPYVVRLMVAGRRYRAGTNDVARDAATSPAPRDVPQPS